jgi:hypothetical protein
MVRRIFGHKEKNDRRLEKIQNLELHYLYSRNIIRENKEKYQGRFLHTPEKNDLET